MKTYQGDRQLQALGDPTRRAIVAVLAAGPRSVGAIAEQLPVSRPAVSQHLKVLKDAALVRDEAQGTRRVYALDPVGAIELRRFLQQFWQAELADLARAAHEHQQEGRQS